jgi:GT2 family glycosyltransferase
MMWIKASEIGAAAQRNQGIACADQPFIAFFDDDILFEADCITELWNAIRYDEELGGVSAMIVNQQYVTPGMLSRAMFTAMHGRRVRSWAGRVIGPAINLLPGDHDSLPPVVAVEWMNTTCTIYRRDALPFPPFDLAFTGYSIMEDLALSLRVGKKWRLANVRTARIVHDSQSGGEGRNRSQLAEMELINRHYVMTKVLDRSKLSDLLKLALYELFQLATLLYHRPKTVPAVVKGQLRALRVLLRPDRKSDPVSNDRSSVAALKVLGRRGGMQSSARMPGHRVAFVAGAMSIAILCLLIAFSPRHFVYDEGAHIANAVEVHRAGWIATLTSASNISAAGPLFTAIQLFFEPLTKLSAPGIRLPNLVCITSLVLVVARTAQSLRLRYPGVGAFSILGVPFLWPAAGMALTEVPALLFYTGSIYFCIVAAQTVEDSVLRRAFYAVLGGLLLGLACLGRQTYLATLFAVPFLFSLRPKSMIPSVLIIFCAVSVCGWLFWIWGGLVPPTLKITDAGLQFYHGVLSFSYLALATLFLAPRWLLVDHTLEQKKALVLYGIGLLAFFVSLVYPFAEIAPARTLMGQLLSPPLFAWYPRVIPAVLTSLAALWGTRFVWEIWCCRALSVWNFLHFSLLILALTPIKISHQFSSRYVVTDLVLLTLVVWKRPPIIGWFYLMRFGSGVCLGTLILRTYFV